MSKSLGCMLGGWFNRRPDDQADAPQKPPQGETAPHGPDTADQPCTIARYHSNRALHKTIFGRVEVATDSKTGQRVVLKISDIARVQTARDFASRSNGKRPLFENPVRECALLKSVQGHRNVVGFVAEHNTPQHHVAVLEFVSGGDMLAFVQQGAGSTGDADRHKRLTQLYFAQTAAALRHLHVRDVAHLDVSLENILLSVCEGGAGEEAKLCDFGMARRFTRSPSGRCARMRSTSSNFGKPHYVAPEIVEGKAFRPTHADVYSLGMVALISLLKVFPYTQPNAADSRFNAVYQECIGDVLQDWNMRDLVPEDALDLLEHMVCPPERRYTMEEVLAHPYVTDILERGEASNGDASDTDIVSSFY